MKRELDQIFIKYDRSRDYLTTKDLEDLPLKPHNQLSPSHRDNPFEDSTKSRAYAQAMRSL